MNSPCNHKSSHYNNHQTFQTFEVNLQNPVFSVILSVKAAAAEVACKLQYDSEIAEDCTIPLQLHLRLRADEGHASFPGLAERKLASSITVSFSCAELDVLMSLLSPEIRHVLLCHVFPLFLRRGSTFSQTHPLYIIYWCLVFRQLHLNTSSLFVF